MLRMNQIIITLRNDFTERFNKNFTWVLFFSVTSGTLWSSLVPVDPEPLTMWHKMNNQEIMWVDILSTARVQVKVESHHWSSQPIHITYIRGLGEIIASFPLCFCGTIQPPQVALPINSVWAGEKPLLGSAVHVWKPCHLHGLSWQLALWWV